MLFVRSTVGVVGRCGQSLEVPVRLVVEGNVEEVEVVVVGAVEVLAELVEAAGLVAEGNVDDVEVVVVGDGELEELAVIGVGAFRSQFELEVSGRSLRGAVSERLEVVLGVLVVDCDGLTVVVDVVVDVALGVPWVADGVVCVADGVVVAVDAGEVAVWATATPAMSAHKSKKCFMISPASLGYRFRCRSLHRAVAIESCSSGRERIVFTRVRERGRGIAGGKRIGDRLIQHLLADLGWSRRRAFFRIAMAPRLFRIDLMRLAHA